MKQLAVIALGCAALAQIGCGGNSDEEEISEVVERMTLALNTEDPQAACSVMTDGMRDFTGPSSDCSEWRTDDVRTMRGVGVNPFPGSGAVAPSSVLVDDDRATASFDEVHARIELEKVDGEWQVDSLLTG